MSQTWTDDVYAAGHVGQTDLQNMENNFATLKSLFSGAAQPASMAACHPWFDTTQHVLKVRDDGDAAWIGLMHGDISQKIWIYRNDAMNGWAIDSGVSDGVLALKGGATYTTGAATAGTWTQPNHTHTGPSHTHAGPSHNHKWYENNLPGSLDETFDVDGNAATLGLGVAKTANGRHLVCSVTNSVPIEDAWTKSGGTGATGAGGTGATGGGATINTHRPAAAVGTLQYLDL